MATRLINRVAVGKRGSGRSSFVTTAIGIGTGTIVIVETDHDMEHHKRHSPEATVVHVDELPENSTLLARHSCVAIDNVIFGPNDPLLDEIMNSISTPSVILCVSHPNSVPAWYDGPITFLSRYT